MRGSITSNAPTPPTGAGNDDKFLDRRGTLSAESRAVLAHGALHASLHRESPQRMNPLSIGVVVLLAVAAAAWWLLRRKAPAPMPVVTRRVAAGAPAALVANDAPPRAVEAPTAPGAPKVVPPELAGFRWLDAEDLPLERRKAYVSVFRDVPRPPRLLDQLLAPGFVQTAASAQLVDLISAEPLIAAKILATVNSPMYGLSRPVTGIGQAVTYLGLDAVRGLCLQYILILSFKADGAERARRLESTWAASAIASELVQQLAAPLGFDERGALVSAVVLSFLGRLATTAASPEAILASIPARPFLERTSVEQAKLGLSASEIGRLLMTEWGLPAGVVQDAADVDRMLVTPPEEIDPRRGARMALCYLCARLGERLATGELADLESFDLETQAGAELHHLRAFIEGSALSRLPWLLRSPDVTTPVRRVQASLRR